MGRAMKVSPDAPPIRETDAVRLMVHHLSLAAMYFENTPDTSVESLAEIADVFDRNTLAIGPARIWYEAIKLAYEAEDRPAGPPADAS